MFDLQQKVADLTAEASRSAELIRSLKEAKEKLTVQVDTQLVQMREVCARTSRRLLIVCSDLRW